MVKDMVSWHLLTLKVCIKDAKSWKTQTLGVEGESIKPSSCLNLHFWDY